jgi:hypothetical protein
LNLGEQSLQNALIGIRRLRQKRGRASRQQKDSQMSHVVFLSANHTLNSS